jgi:hypothetical protein
MSSLQIYINAELQLSRTKKNISKADIFVTVLILQILTGTKKVTGVPHTRKLTMSGSFQSSRARVLATTQVTIHTAFGTFKTQKN